MTHRKQTVFHKPSKTETFSRLELKVLAEEEMTSNVIELSSCECVK